MKRLQKLACTIFAVLALLLAATAPSEAGSRGGQGFAGHGGGHGFAGHGGGHGSAGHGFSGHHGGSFHHGFRGRAFIGVAPFFAAPLLVGPAYPYWWGSYAYSPPVYAPPPVYSAPPAQYWYYCPRAGGYYPSVPSCPEPWIPVPAQ